VGRLDRSLCPVVELRQYTLRPGRFDALIDVFETFFLDGQEAAGITVIGQFRDLDDPDRFVWLRGFPDMDSRAESLAAFYDGPIWKAHREEANATMVDSDDVLLLKPARAGSGFSSTRSRPPRGDGAQAAGGFVVARVSSLRSSAEVEERVSRFEAITAPAIRAAGAGVLACFVSEPAANNFPRLPVRSGEQVFAWFAGAPERAVLDRVVSRAAAEPPFPREGSAQLLRLAPTPRSRVTGGSAACAAFSAAPPLPGGLATGVRP